MDLTSLLAPILAPLIEHGVAQVVALVIASIPIIREWMMASRARRISLAVARGAGIAFVDIVRAERWEDELARGIDVAASYVAGRMPKTLRAAGVDATALGDMAKGELGKLLAAAPPSRSLLLPGAALSSVVGEVTKP